jgi:2-polyprenyl-3-methyl-5-hydroxy-6-metoxy-1,4-benzoquinol methylase
VGFVLADLAGTGAEVREVEHRMLAVRDRLVARSWVVWSGMFLAVAAGREAQLAYSDLQPAMSDEDKRRRKAQRIVAVSSHFLGADDLSGLVVADVGCSVGIIAADLASAGARVVGLDIDVPGLGRASSRHSGSGRLAFVCGDSQRSPLADASVDMIVCNHVYEHVVSPEALVSEIHRILKPSGVAYLALGNVWGVVEPHYRLPFLSYLPRSLAHRYVQATGRATHYHEAFRTREQLRRLFSDFTVWDYSYSVMAEPERFSTGIPARLGPVASVAARVLRPILPTFIWAATTGPSSPAGPPLVRPPRCIVGDRDR